MIGKLVKSLFGSRNERVLKNLYKKVAEINAFEPSMQALSDEQLRQKTNEFKQRIAQGESLDELLPEAFAVVREASVRTLGLRHFDVQLIGGMVLHQGNIAEMLTGEGKTLVATLPTYLNALSGKGVHIVTVNDYLARRDAEWMRPIYALLGLQVGINLTGMTHAEKQVAYQADITYGTNNEYGFDYLRDNMAFSLDARVQRELNFAIVDEVDSILIDEARTPLIISGPTEDNSERYMQINALIPQLTKQEEEDGPGDYMLDEKAKQAYLTEDGHQRVEEMLVAAGLLRADASLYDAANVTLMHHVNAALRAHTLFQKDVDYIVKNNQIVIVDEHTGRLMQGRRWSDGLHQAVEAKEGVAIQNENQTLASITFQNYFRSYDKLAGMTGTADTEAYEFHQIYNLEVVVIPPNRPVQRKDLPDKVYISVEEKFKAIIEEIKECRERGQPALVGTTSVEMSELLSNQLQKANIPHEVLNAKQHEREAHIITQAGRPGMVTIATNMAGRGTDIVLGGNLDAELAALENPSEAAIQQHRQEWQQRHEQVIKAGGLHVLGTERHESRRIDNQLRGRSGRQGDPGSSRFYLSLGDNLLRIFASERLSGIMQRLGVKEGEALESTMLSRVIENAQRKVEGHNFDIRKQLLEFDNVANEQRRVVYAQRSELMAEDDVSETVQAIFEHVADQTTASFIPEQSFAEQWDIAGLDNVLRNDFAVDLGLEQRLQEDESLTEETIKTLVHDALLQRYQQQQELIGDEVMKPLQKSLLLQTLDSQWKDHLAAMDHLRQGIHLRGYAQKNPKQEYKREAFTMFQMMLDNLKHDVVSKLARVQVQREMPPPEMTPREADTGAMHFIHEEANAIEQAAQQQTGDVDMTTQSQEKVTPFVREAPKVGRNEPCPCGSGKKFKQCHGKIS